MSRIRSRMRNRRRRRFNKPRTSIIECTRDSDCRWASGPYGPGVCHNGRCVGQGPSSSGDLYSGYPIVQEPGCCFCGSMGDCRVSCCGIK